MKNLCIIMVLFLSVFAIGCTPEQVEDYLRASTVKTALEKQGSSYKWGASGPNQFDCSGLVVYSFKAAGKSLPRTSQAMRASTKWIDKSEVIPGDLVFIGRPVHHVGIYLGENLMVHSPRRGDVVKISPINSRRQVSYGRV